MDQPDVKICNGDAISIFLGKCIEVDGYQFCPNVPDIFNHTIDQYAEEEEEEDEEE